MQLVFTMPATTNERGEKMNLNFSADEIFKIAEQMERNGVKFYTSAAKEAGENEDTKNYFLKLADMEKEHETVFARMRERLTGGQNVSAFDPDGHVALYLQAWADGKIFDEKGELAEVLVEQKSIQDILKIAIGLEKDSILFYLGMKEMTESEESKNEIDNIIKEEMAHVAYLNKERSQFVH